jgi:hypothetical protein
VGIDVRDLMRDHGRPLLPSTMLRRSIFVLLTLASGCHVRPESLVPVGGRAQAEPESEYLRGDPAAFVVLGDTTSFVWPAMLQELLDAHAAKRGLYRVHNGATPAQGIGAWKETREPGPFRALSEDFLSARAAARAGAPLPKTALCMVSLRGIGDEGGPVKSENDMVGAEMGADALERLALELHELGVERVVFATPFYAEGTGPELGLEHVALERLLARGHDFVAAGPDVFRASRRYFPDAFEAGGTEPNEFGVKLMAEEWYRWLAGPEARERVVEALYATDYDVEAIEAAHVAEHGPLRN